MTTTVIPTSAMVLAAGLGLRMRPITDHTPKPLIEIAGRSLLDRALDHLAAVGVETAVVNVHHLAGKVQAAVAARDAAPKVEISDETAELLETGGGVKKALPLLGPKPFYVVNSDILWLNGTRPALFRLARAWERARMDALLLLKRTSDAHGYEGYGDFFMDPEGLIRRRREKEVAPYIYAGVMIIKPEVFAGTPDGPWSLNLVFDKLLARGTLRGIAHDGPWFHVGTPDAIAPTERRIHAERMGENDDESDYASGP